MLELRIDKQGLFKCKFCYVVGVSSINRVLQGAEKVKRNLYVAFYKTCMRKTSTYFSFL